MKLESMQFGVTLEVTVDEVLETVKGLITLTPETKPDRARRGNPGDLTPRQFNEVWHFWWIDNYQKAMDLIKGDLTDSAAYDALDELRVSFEAEIEKAKVWDDDSAGN